MSVDVEQLLADASAARLSGAARTASDELLIIDPETRQIAVPENFLLGVESDQNVERVRFQCPKIVGDNIDLSKLHIYVNYRNANQEVSSYWCQDVEVEGDNITFSWLLSRAATMYQGETIFIVCAKKSDEEGNLTNEWNTTIPEHGGIVLEGLEPDPRLEQQYPDVIEQILTELDTIKAGGGGGGSAANGIPPGGTTGQVLAKKTDSDYDVEWKDELTGTSDQYFEVVKQVASSNVFLEQQPDTFSGNDNWYYGNYGKPLYQATKIEQFYYNKLTFTGTIYIRCLTINQYSTPGLCSVYTCSSNVLPENWTEENGAVELLSPDEKTIQFTLGDKTGYVYVNNDGTYEINPSSKEESSPNNGYIVLLKYTIPEGKYGWIVFVNSMGAGSSNSKWNEKGYPSVFTTSPIDNIVQDIFSVDSSSSDGQLQTKTPYTSGFMRFIAENSEFQSYISDKINSFLPLTAKKQTYGKSIYIGGDSLHQYAGGDGKTTEGFVTNWNKYLGFSNVKNDGYAGSTWTQLTGGGGLKRAKDLISNGTVYDVIILAWGTNDDTGGNGTIEDEASDTEGATMVAAMKWIITNLRSTFKSTAIGVIIPPPKGTEDGMKTRGDLMIQVCEVLHVPYVDMREYISISDLGSDTVHLGEGAGKYGAAEASLILRICQYGDTLYPGTTD